MSFGALSESEPVALTYGPDESKAFGGLTAQQYSYCELRARGVAKLHAYRQAFANERAVDATIQDAAYKLELLPRIAQTINRMVLADSGKTTLVPRIEVTKDFVLEGITNIATSKTAKDNVRLRAYELLGKTVGLFKDAEPQQTKTRTLEDIDRELREKLEAMRTIEGAAVRTSKPDGAQADSVEPAADRPPAARRDRRRRPKPE